MAKLTTAGSLGATDSTVEMGTANAAQVGVNVTGTWTGTITFEVRRGSTWENAQVFSVSGTGVAATTTANVSRRIDTGGTNAVRARFSTASSGAPLIQFDGTEAGMGGSGGGGGGGGAVTIADGADVAEGSTTDAAVTTDTSGTVIGFLRGAIVKWVSLLARIPAALTGSGNFKTSIAESTATVTVDSELPAAAALSDATANPTAPMVGAALMGWDGSAWERNVLAVGADAKNNALVGIITYAWNSVFNGTTWDRLRSATADALASTGLLAVGGMAFNGSTWDRLRADGQKQLQVAAAGYTTVITSTLTRPNNTTAYTAGDEITDTGGAIITLTSVARYSGGTGSLQGLFLIFSDNWAVKPTIRAYIFDTTSTPQTDNAAFAPSDSVLATAIATVDLTVANTADATGSTGNMSMDSGQINIPFLTVGSANLFIRFQITNAGQAGANSSTITVRARVSCD